MNPKKGATSWPELMLKGSCAKAPGPYSNQQTKNYNICYISFIIISSMIKHANNSELNQPILLQLLYLSYFRLG